MSQLIILDSSGDTRHEFTPQKKFCKLPKGMANWEADAIRNTFRKACTEVTLCAQVGDWEGAARARAVSESLMRCWPTLGLGAYSEVVY